MDIRQNKFSELYGFCGNNVHSLTNFLTFSIFTFFQKSIFLLLEVEFFTLEIQIFSISKFEFFTFEIRIFHFRNSNFLLSKINPFIFQLNFFNFANQIYIFKQI